MISQNVYRLAGLHFTVAIILGYGTTAQAWQAPAPAKGPIVGHFSYNGSATFDDAARSLTQMGWVITAPTKPPQFDASLAGSFSDDALEATKTALKNNGWVIDPDPAKTSASVTAMPTIAITANLAAPSPTPPPAKGPIVGHFSYEGTATFNDAANSLLSKGWVITAPTTPGLIDGSLAGDFTDNQFKATGTTLEGDGWQIDFTKTSMSVTAAPIVITAKMTTPPPPTSTVIGHFSYASFDAAARSLMQLGWVNVTPSSSAQINASLPGRFTDDQFKAILSTLQNNGWDNIVPDPASTSPIVTGKPITVTASLTDSPTISAACIPNLPRVQKCPRCLKMADSESPFLCSTPGFVQPAGPFAPPRYSYPWLPEQIVAAGNCVDFTMELSPSVPMIEPVPASSAPVESPPVELAPIPKTTVPARPTSVRSNVPTFRAVSRASALSAVRP